MYGIKTVVLRHSSMYGGRQFSTYDQGWIGWFCQQALNIKNGKHGKPFTISGNGKQVRDILHADDMGRLYLAVINNIEKAKGEAFNIGGGIGNSLSLLELFNLLEGLLGIRLRYEKIAARASDQKVFVADISKAERLLGWSPKVGCRSGIEKMLEWIPSQQ